MITNVKLIYPKLSYRVNGLLYAVHNELGRYAREKQYGDSFSRRLSESQIAFAREVRISDTGNIVDFMIESRILIELKSVRSLSREHYRQIQNYLQQSRLKLGLLVNFRQQLLKPIRIIRIDSNDWRHSHIGMLTAS